MQHRQVTCSVLCGSFHFLCWCALATTGPTVLEVFNTLLKHLRMSVDFELGETSRRNSSSSISSVRGKESEERIVQNAIIQTIGTASQTCSYVVCHCLSRADFYAPCSDSNESVSCSLKKIIQFYLVPQKRGLKTKNVLQLAIDLEILRMLLRLYDFYSASCCSVQTTQLKTDQQLGVTLSAHSNPVTQNIPLQLPCPVANMLLYCIPALIKTLFYFFWINIIFCTRKDWSKKQKGMF